MSSLSIVIIRESQLSAVSLRRLCRSTVLLLAVGTLPAAFACPPGQHEVCLGGCFCMPGSREDMGAIYDNISQITATGLQEWIVQARSSVPAADIQPIPLAIRAQLEPFYDFQVLEAARYKVGGEEELSAANAVLQNPDVNAVTLVDLIVFRTEADARDNVALWAHELMHVQQYLQWGVSEFASRYTRDHQAVEKPAYEIQRRVAATLRAGTAL